MAERKPRYRKHVRLRGYDYGHPGAYFVTLVTRERLPLLDGKTSQDTRGELRGTSQRYPAVSVGTHVIMPDHLHMVLWLRGGSPRLSRILQAFKSLTTRRFRSRGGVGRLWQPNYFEHVIRTEEALQRIERYITENPEMVEIDVPSFYRPLGEPAAG